jgi:hypothetical protein
MRQLLKVSHSGIERHHIGGVHEEQLALVRAGAKRLKSSLQLRKKNG